MIDIKKDVTIGDCNLIGFEPRAVIYAFRKDGVITYVGSTTNAMHQRLRAHLNAAATGSDTRVHQWIRSVDGSFDVVCLAYVPAHERDMAETHWIKVHRTKFLRNMTDGGKGLSGYRPTKDRNKKISDSKKKGAFFNCIECDDPFWRKPRDIKRGHNKFCSRGCYQVWQRGKTKSGSK